MKRRCSSTRNPWSRKSCKISSGNICLLSFVSSSGDQSWKKDCCPGSLGLPVQLCALFPLSIELVECIGRAYHTCDYACVYKRIKVKARVEMFFLLQLASIHEQKLLVYRSQLQKKKKRRACGSLSSSLNFDPALEETAKDLAGDVCENPREDSSPLSGFNSFSRSVRFFSLWRSRSRKVLSRRVWLAIAKKKIKSAEKRRPSAAVNEAAHNL